MLALVRRLTESDRKALLVLSVVIMLPVLVVGLVAASGFIVGLLALLNIFSPPAWALWALLAAETFDVVVGILAALGVYNPPSWLVWAIIVAGSIGI